VGKRSIANQPHPPATVPVEKPLKIARNQISPLFQKLFYKLQRSWYR